MALAEIDKGSATHLWPAVASQFPRTGKDRLFVFPGGRYNNATDFEYLRNSIYSYVTPMNIDAAIVWTSSMTNPLDADAVTQRFKAIKDIPHVTISGKNSIEPECTDITFEAYSGMVRVVQHCIEEHNSRRIAFIRGPENHSSAQERFQAYRDALDEHGIEFDPLIVSDPFPWDSGTAAIRQLVIDRHLMPGVDFDTLICSSDLMMLQAGRELLSMGIGIPQDVRICGFNDTPEARLLGIPCTTVRTPFQEIGLSAIRKLREILETGTSHQDVTIKTIPIFRRSCGCGVTDDIRIFRTEDELYNHISNMTGIPACDLSEKIRGALQSGTESDVSNLVTELLTCIDDILPVTTLIQMISAQPFFDVEKRIRFNQNALIVVVEYRGHKVFMDDYNRMQYTAKINTLRYDLFRANSPRIINSILRHKLKDIGIQGADLVLFNKDGTSSFFGSDSTRVGDDREETFPSSLILPHSKMDGLEPGVYIMEPLFTENEVFGYLVIHTESYDGSTCEEIRSCVSSIVKNCLLLEETNRAKQALEDAEQKRVSFFEKVGSKVKEPLKELEGMVRSMAATDAQRSLMSDKVKSAQDILDSVLITAGNIDLSLTTTSLSEPLAKLDPKFKNIALPMLNIDEKLIIKAIQAINKAILLCKGKPELTVSEGTTGVSISVMGGGNCNLDHRGTEEITETILFARAIFMAHSGTLTNEGDSFTAFIPYPNVANQAVQYQEPNTMLCIGGIPENPPARLRTILLETAEDLVQNSMQSYIRDNGCILYINIDGHDLRRADFLHEIEDSQILSTLPVICIGKAKASSLSAALHLSIDSTEYNIMYIGDFSTTFTERINRRKAIHCTMEEAPKLISESCISTIILHLAGISAETLRSSVENLRRNTHQNTPIVVFSDKIDVDIVDSISETPNIILYNSCFMDDENCFFRILVVSYQASILPPLTGAIVKKAQAFLDRHALDQISRWQIASEVHVSEDYLTNIFKKELGMSPWDYLIALRMDYGSNLLKNTGIPISEVSRRSGFHDSSYFSRVFKKIKGISPTKVRNSQ
ncbi:MAG: substrate-binding domain-containing protein [Spirochaetales bacterium]|nr:substrate-binding domain-containing protein [Spirochaetales bacterium]